MSSESLKLSGQSIACFGCLFPIVQVDFLSVIFVVFPLQEEDAKGKVVVQNMRSVELEYVVSVQ